ncbi:MAG: SDR family oxidoreductase [Ruminococcus flavefaciens]|nr:SDR family oxidoreductase [Ruminococcus flavefaciens]MCM1229600.1 SDR family oxidoreductase [Ruminococcus flavefaciens]
MIDVRGKWALITGASRGLGRLIARAMAEQGCNLILHSRSNAHCQAVLDEVRACGVEAYTVQAELSDMAQLEAMLAEIDEKGIQPDIIFNNAGLQTTYRTNFLETPYEEYETSFRINTIAPMMICYHFAKGMAERGFGRIINTSSDINLEPQQGPYSASKAGLDKVTRDFAHAFIGTDVVISLTNPAWCKTDMGGENAYFEPETAIPGLLVGAFVADKKQGRYFNAQDFRGMSLAEAVTKAEMQESPYL